MQTIAFFLFSTSQFMPSATTLSCPLCSASQISFYHRDNKRQYNICAVCHLVFVSPEFLPSRLQEQQEYALHENSLDDDGYRLFLNRAAEAIADRIQPGMIGLDFGCGPAPLLARMLEERGLVMHTYDPLFCPDDSVLHNTYDIITCTEAIEHFHQPIIEVNQLFRLLRAGGTLLIMTKRVIDVQRFATWHYKNDPTHVCFFSDATFLFLATKHQCDVEFIGNDIVLMQKPV